MSDHPKPRPAGRSRVAAVAATIAAAAAIVLAPAPAGAAVKPVKVADDGTFYQPPKKLPKGHGKLIWFAKAPGLVDTADSASTDKLLYTSKSPQGDQVAVSGSVSVPKGKPPKGGWPLITWDHGTTGLADACAPSKFETGSAGEPFINRWIDEGYAVVRTDYQGLGTPGPHAYLIGKAAARSALDIISAARQLYPAIGHKYVIAGHSQGGHAALWTANYAESWAPDYSLEGTMAFAPASHIAQQTSLLPALTSPNPLSALAVSILAGAATANPRIDPAALLNDAPYALYPDVQEKCLGDLGKSDSLGGIAPSDLLRDGANLHPLEKVLNKNNPAVTTSAPILVLQGLADSTVFPQYTSLLVGELEDKGDDVTYKTYPGEDHGGVMTAGLDDADAFLAQNLPAK